MVINLVFLIATTVSAVIEQARTATAPRLTRTEQERRLARVVDAAIQNRKAQVVD